VTKGARERFVVVPGTAVDLTAIDPRSSAGVDDRDDAARRIPGLKRVIDDGQRRLYAERKRAVLVVLQGMDTSGKDGAIRHAFAALSPSGTRVTAFGKPTEEELEHGFLWRVRAALPGPGQVGIFNRSHSEDVVAVRVRQLAPPATWGERFGAINAFERELVEQGITTLKVFLHISKDEQRERLLARLDDPAKRWKFNPSDLDDRARWDDFRVAWQDAIARCSTADAPWFVVPADRKWYRNWAVSALLAETLDALDPRYPMADFDVEEMRRRLGES
jgi:PPK2 family polyphosphate:nucleotide phosphotransferase